MNWLDRVRRAACRLEVGGGIVDLLAWNYASELNNNVPHRHTFFEVCQVGAHGAADFIVEGQKHRVAPGDVFFARPGVVHQIVNTERRHMELFWVCWAWNPGRERGEIA
ncbi:MAG TPA: cupin domain-containing protein, partial [Abditibacteriaceae bacterium]